MSDNSIEPNQVYKTPQAAKLLNISERTLLEEINKGTIPAKNIGKGWKILGSNLLIYISTPTNITQQMQPNYTGGVVTSEEFRNTKPNTHDTLGVAPITPENYNPIKPIPLTELEK